MGNAYHRNQLFNIIIMGLYAAWVYFNSHFPFKTILEESSEENLHMACGRNAQF